MDTVRYSVFTSGELQKGFDYGQVQNSLVALFDIPADKAGRIVKRRQLMKKNVSRDTAEKLKTRLESIGMVVKLKKYVPETDTTDLSFFKTNVPSPDKKKKRQSSHEKIINCPKCKVELPADAAQCQACGVYLHKLPEQNDDATAVSSQQTAQASDGVAAEADECLTGKSILAGAIVALVGALIWKFIASTFGYESGIIAWVIGAAIGFVVTVTGSHGQNAGLVCGALALLAIIGGKYFIYAGYQDDLSAFFSRTGDEVHYIYEAQKAASAAHAEAVNNGSLRQFMIDYGYSEHEKAGDVSADEVANFMERDEMELVKFNVEQPAFDEWYRSNISADLGNISTTGLMIENVTFVDFIFLLLGVGTAFRLGYGRDN